MTFRTLLTITAPKLGYRDLKLAADLCAEIEAHLSVLVVALAAPPPIGEYAAMVSDAWLEQRQEDMRELQKKLAAVSMELAASPLSTDVASVYTEMAWADEVIGRRARY